MKAHPPFVAPRALAREIPVAAGASRMARSAEIGAGCPSFGGQRTAASSRKRIRSSRSGARTPLIEEPNYKSASFPQGQKSLAFLVIYPRPQFECQSGSLRLQRWYASPSKYKTRLPAQERGLTLQADLPSAGRLSQTLGLIQMPSNHDAHPPIQAHFPRYGGHCAGS